MTKANCDDPYVRMVIVLGLLCGLCFLVGSCRGRMLCKEEACMHKAAQYIVDPLTGSTAFKWNDEIPTPEQAGKVK